MKFIKTKGFYFNSDQILGFAVYEKKNSSGNRYYTVNAMPLNIDHRDRSAVIEEFDRREDAHQFLAELVAELNAEEINHVES